MNGNTEIERPAVENKCIGRYVRSAAPTAFAAVMTCTPGRCDASACDYNTVAVRCTTAIFF
jgi:hypothetical protein